MVSDLRSGTMGLDQPKLLVSIGEKIDYEGVGKAWDGLGLHDRKNEDTPVGANCCKSLQDKHLGDEGIEPSTAALRVRCSTN